MPDFLLNGQAHGGVAAQLLAHNFDVGALRPWMGRDGRSYITVNQNGRPVNIVVNAPTSLRKDEWIMLDEVVLKSAALRMRAFADLRAAGLVLNLPNGMAKTMLEYQTQGDVTPATISMDGLRQSEADRPEYDLRSLPLPIVHKDFNFSARQIAVSRNGSTPLDTTTAELAGRRVAEEVEKMTTGGTSFAYGGGTVYGYINLPQRNTKTLTVPTGSNGATTVTEVLDMRKKAYDDKFFGPFMLYVSPNWDQFLDNDYVAAAPQNTLRQRLKLIEGIQDIRTLDHLGTATYQMILVQMTSDVARAVVGMDITTVQWESHGGMQVNFKVLCILVPQIRYAHDSGAGIVHGTN